jgi:hypothetical protein
MRSFPVRVVKYAVAAIAALCISVVAAIPARAGLGDNISPPASNADAIGGGPTRMRLRPDQMAANTRYTSGSFVMEDGTTVREYCTLSGLVFGVAWEGARPPELKMLFGAYYPEYAAAAVDPSRRRFGLHHSVILGPDTVVVMDGHMGYLTGRAYVPSLVPSGVDPNTVVK